MNVSKSPNYEALSSDIALSLLQALAGNKKSESLWIQKWPDFGFRGCNSPSPIFAAGFLEGDHTFMEKRKFSIQSKWGRSQVLSV